MKGHVCHGLDYPTAVLGNAVSVPRLSDKCKELVQRLLRTGVQPIDIILEHQKMLKTLRESDQKDTIWPRDAQLCLKDVLNIQQRLRQVLHNYHSNDAISTEMWIEQHQENVIFHQRKCEAEKQPFILVVSSPWMLEKLAEFGHDNAVAFEATFGSNCYGNSLFTVLCFDSFQNGLPCCWAITERQQTVDVEKILTSVKNRAGITRRETLDLPGDWSPSCMIVDDTKEEQLAISHVFPGMPVLLCLWHVRRAWIKQLHAKVSNPIVKADMNRFLGNIMYATEDMRGAQNLSDQFLEEFKHENKFVDYREHWHPRLQKWSKEFREFKHNNQNTNGAIERWHRTLKVHLRASRKGKSNRRVSWLLHILIDTIENHYWCMASLKQQGKIRNNIMKELVVTAIEHAETIPDQDVSMHIIDSKKCAFVRSQTRPWQQHEVTSFVTDSAACTCSQGAQGNTCKHQSKCLLLLGYSQVAIVQRLGTFAGTIAGGMDLLTGSDPALGLECDLNVMGGSEESEPALNEPEAEAVPCVTSDTPKIMSEEEAYSLVQRMWAMVRPSSTLSAHATTIMQDAHERVADLVARCAVLEKQDGVESFKVIPGTNGSLKRLPDFVERFMGRATKRMSPRLHADTDIAVENFSRRQSDRLSMQATLDRAALQSIDLNIAAAM